MIDEERVPLYFGAPGRRLFGCLHRPATVAAVARVLVVCQPTGQEYIRSHRASLMLAAACVRAGMAAFRFDLFGCGDSQGDETEATIRSWIRDVSSAIAEARRRAQATRVCLFGLRIGGALALAAGAERGDIEATAVWDPVVRGDEYLDELREQHRQMLRHSYVRQGQATAGGEETELLGFRLGPSQREQLVSIDLTRSERPPAGRLLAVRSREASGSQLPLENWQSAGCLVERRETESPRVWLEEPNRGLVPRDLWNEVISWLERGA